MNTAYVCGNGPSLSLHVLEKLDGPVYGVNRIWKLPGWKDTTWRPDYYVRCEVPFYNMEHVREDMLNMADFNGTMYLQAGFRGLDYGEVRTAMGPHTTVEYFETACDGTHPHPWHLPGICGYGTVVHIAMQIAVLNGATKIRLLGCDLGLPVHFYGEEGAANDDLARQAHYFASVSCPVPIEDCGIGSLEMYEHRT